MKKGYLKELVESFDEDKNGEIDLVEFLQGIGKVSVGILELLKYLKV